MYAGIDIAKQSFDVTLQGAEGKKVHNSFPNNEKGFKAQVKWLRKQGAKTAHVCMEATNIYWEGLAEYLHGAGYRVSVVNPARIAGYARSQMQRNKNDKIDSGVACDFCATQQPAAWEPPSATQKELRSLERHRDDLQKMRTQTKNRLATAKEPKVRQSLQRVLDNLNEEMAEMDKQMETLVKETPTLKAHFTLLRSIISLGPRTALKLLAEMYDLASYHSADAAAADAGLTPASYESGTTVRKKPKMSKVGKAAVRGALFLPAMSAIRFNPLLRTFAERLRSKGKSEKVIIGAVMRKLMHLAYGVLKHETPFDPNYRQSKPMAA